MKPSESRKRYNLNQCALYCCRSKSKLFKLLGTNAREIRNLTENMNEQYSIFDLEKKGGGTRTVHGPSPRLKRIQKTLYKYLRKVERPSWLISGELGKSVIDNVRPHQFAGDMIKLDISGFFDNCKREPVFQFFHTILRQPGDVASICTELCMLNGAIVQGSPTSMVIAFYANRKMLEELQQLASDFGLVFTVYVDDIAFSCAASFDEDALLSRACQIVRAYGFRVKTKKVREYPLEKPKLLTGIVISKKNTLSVPNRVRRTILDSMTSYRRMDDSNAKEKLRQSMLGMIASAQQIEPGIFNSIRGQLLSDRRKQLVS